MIIKASIHVSILSTKHENIQAFDCESIQECDRESIQAYEHFGTQVYTPLISQSTLHLSIIVNAFERTNAKLHDDLNLQAYRHVIIQVCVYVYGYQTYEFQCMSAWEHVIIKLYEHVITKSCSYGSM